MQESRAGTVDAMEFSSLGDEVWNRLADRFPDAGKRRLLIAQTLEPGIFRSLREAMAAYVGACLGGSRTLPEEELIAQVIRRRRSIPNLQADGLLAPKREQILEFNALHRSVAAAFLGFGIEACVDTIDLPINVRLVFGESNATARSLPFASSKLHSDVWAGVPVDAVVVVMPIFGDIEHLTIECGEMARGVELEAMRGMSDYLEGSRYGMEVPYQDRLEHGTVYLADARLLHQTVRKRDSGLRISIDFRWRHNDQDYRRLAPVVTGPDGGDHRVPYRGWLAVGSDSLVVFDETMADAEARKSSATVTGRPVGMRYRLVRL